MSSDVRDILQLPADAGKTTSSIRNAVKAERVKEKKSDGLNRELLSLTGGAPPMVLAKKKYKARPNFSKRTAVSPWVWRSFTNPARRDNLELYHWVKATDAEDYYFAKFNEIVDMVDYTEEEYNAHLKDKAASSGWTREETDYLFSLCKAFDLRWFVIFDRYDWPNHTRTIDDLKERYYQTARAILLARGKPDKKDLTGYNFDKAREIERKKNLEILYNRTAEQIKEEEYLFMELRRREQKEERMQREREAVWQLLNDNEVRLANREGLTPIDKNVEKLKKRKSVGSTKRASSEDVSSPVMEVGPSNSARKRSKVKEEPAAEEDSAHKIKYPVGAFARSSKLPAPKTALVPRVHQFLQELGLGIKPNMPTAPVCAKFNELQMNIQTLLEVKKLYDKVDLELSKMRVKARVMGGGQAGGSSAVPQKRSSLTPSSAQKDLKRQRTGA
ncbi:uncharacterized protein SPPG_07930 [Spizellomyces punctatus DAOM BR117]|uniref:SWR1-complex protein 4 n=1 Tax=Spizellomyces punctatus (strain DAOM BR117) TaxID=645134 RepID=A0A0L0H765_SPIPD|nr:uncharacterized protein SPPG_07930 [Spizellomyces punctatus DAOM BR117]KNC96721.1 hypothetical protein SPPG_07930 [Spizellomyces punctatus DAOM BR117]|eukprot:XP_016604761.1 hypothetical protein SPPG_07930 [Spizellomyces punctatus DAOM BR117]